MVYVSMFCVIGFLLICSTLGSREASVVVNIHGRGDLQARLQSPPSRTYNFEETHELNDNYKNVSQTNASKIMSDDDKPRDRRALGVILQGIAEALGYSTSPISLSTLPNPNTTIAGAAAAPPPVFTIQGGSRVAPAAPPAPPAGSTRPTAKPNPPLPTKPQASVATAATPRQRETLRFTGVVNFGNNSDLLGHLRQYETIFHGGATSTTAAPAPAAQPPANPPNPSLGKPALLQPYFVQIPLPIAPNLPALLPPSAPRKLKQMEHVYAKQEHTENYEGESREISDEKDVRSNPTGDTYIDEPRWKKKQREQQEAEINKYRNENNKEVEDSEESDENEENNYEDEKKIVDHGRKNSAESGKKEQTEDDDDEIENEEAHDNKKQNYKNNEEQREDPEESYESNEATSEDDSRRDKYPKNNENNRYNDDKSSGYDSEDDEADEASNERGNTGNRHHATIKNNFDVSFDKNPSLSRPLGTRLPIRVLDEPYSGVGLRNSYGESLEHGGKLDESVADYFQMYKDPRTGLFDWRKVQSLNVGRNNGDWWHNYQQNFPGLVVDPLERIRQENAPPANARYEEYILDEKEDGGDRPVEHRTRNEETEDANEEEEDEDEEEEKTPRKQRKRMQKLQKEEKYERGEPTLTTHKETRVPVQTSRLHVESGKREQPRVTTYTPVRANALERRFNDRDELVEDVESGSTTDRPTRRLPKARKSNEQEDAVESLLTSYRLAGQPPLVRARDNRDDGTKLRLTTNQTDGRVPQARQTNEQNARVGSRLTTSRPIRARKFGEHDERVESRSMAYHDQDGTVEATVMTYARVKMPTNARRSGNEDGSGVTTRGLRNGSMEISGFSEDKNVDEPVTTRGQTRSPEKWKRASKKDRENSRPEARMSTSVKRRIPGHTRRSSDGKVGESEKRIKLEEVMGNKKKVVTTYEPTQRSFQSKRSNEDIDKSNKSSRSYAEKITPKITRRSSSQDDNEDSRETSKSVENSTRKNVNDDDYSVEGSKENSEDLEPTPLRPLSFKGFDLIKFSPYLRPLQVSYEREKLERTAEKILSLHNFGNPTKGDEDEEADRSNDENDVRKNVGMAGKSIETKFNDDGLLKYNPYLKPIQLVYDPKKLQRTADKILWSQNLGKSARNSDETKGEEVRDADTEDGDDDGSSEKLREDDRASENSNNDDRSSENLHNDDRSSENFNNDDRSSEKSEKDDLATENLRDVGSSAEISENDEDDSDNARKNERTRENLRDTDRSSENSYNDENTSKTVREEDVSLENLEKADKSSKISNSDENDSSEKSRGSNRSSENLRYEDDSSEYYRENDGWSEYLRDLNNEEAHRRSSDFGEQIEFKPDVSVPTGFTESKLYDDEREKVQSWTAPLNRNSEINEKIEIVGPSNGDNLSTRPTDETPGTTKFHRRKPDRHNIDADASPTNETPAIEELGPESQRSSSPEEYFNDSDVSPTYESPYIEKSQTDISPSYPSTNEPTTGSGFEDTEHHHPLGTKINAKNAAILQLREYNYQEEPKTPTKLPEKNPTIDSQPYEPPKLRSSAGRGRYQPEQRKNDEIETTYEGNFGDRIEKTSKDRHQQLNKKFEDPETARKFFDLSKNDYALESPNRDGDHEIEDETVTTTTASLEKELIGLLNVPQAEDPNYQRDVALTEFTNEPESDTEKVKVKEYRNKVATLKVSERKQLSPHGPVQLVGFTRNFQ